MRTRPLRGRRCGRRDPGGGAPSTLTTGDLTVHTTSIAESVAGCRANMMVSEFTRYVREMGFLRAFHVLCRTYSIFAPGMIFNLAMNSSTDPRYYSESEFEEILRSISIG